MQIVLFLLMLLVVKSMTDTSSTDEFDRWRQQGQTIARIMEYYQQQAVLECRTNGCSTGVLVDPVKFPSKPDTVNGDWEYGTSFQSAYDSATYTVITIYYPPQYGSVGNGDLISLFGWVGSTLRDISHNSIYVGQWDAASQTINNGISISYNGTYSNPRVVINQGFGGITLVDHQPIVATRLK